METDQLNGIWLPLDQVKQIFAMAGIPVTRIRQLVNGYYSAPGVDEFNEIRRGLAKPLKEIPAELLDTIVRTISRFDKISSSPWWLVETDMGPIEIGWRKRVISVNWESTGFPAKVTDDAVTQDKFLVHAWDYKSLVVYLHNLHSRWLNREQVEPVNGVKCDLTSQLFSATDLRGFPRAGHISRVYTPAFRHASNPDRVYHVKSTTIKVCTGDDPLATGDPIEVILNHLRMLGHTHVYAVESWTATNEHGTFLVVGIRSCKVTSTGHEPERVPVQVPEPVPVEPAGKPVSTPTGASLPSSTGSCGLSQSPPASSLVP